MLELLCLILGSVIAVPSTLLYVQLRHRNRMREDENRYKTAWNNSLDMMVAGGQLTEEQRIAITPKVPAPPIDRGASWDRRDVEIARAEAKLPPADDLEGMASWDRAEVLKARIKNGTTELGT